MAALAGFTGWPPEFADRYRAAGYWRDELLGDLAAAGAARWPDRTALVDGDRRWTYTELAAGAAAVAAGLRRLGLGDGDRLLVHLPNVAEFVLLLLGAARIGAVPVCALPAHRETELTHLARLAGARAYVAADVAGGYDHRPLARRLRATVPELDTVIVVGDPAEFTPFTALSAPDPAPPAPADPPAADPPGPRPGDVAVLLLSGGTTGLPKLIGRTHHDYAYNWRASADVCALTADDRYLVALPAAHNFALACPGLLGALAVGGRVVLCPDADPATVFPLVERERITVTALVPPLALVWLEAADDGGADLSSLRLLQVGGARLGAGVAARVAPVLGCALQQVYGMAEGLLNFTRLDDPPALVHDTQGRPLSPADEVRIVDPTGAEVPDGELGELHTRGPYTLRAYYPDVPATAGAFTADGFYRSGDLVRRLPSGHLRVEGRRTNVVNRGGDKVPVEEVEDLLLRHPDIADVAVVGVPDPVLGERTLAFVVPRRRGAAGPDRRDVAAHLTALGLAAFKIPDRLRVVPDLPRTGVGKVDRRALAARAREHR
ncbi:MAG TPA: AMP-binding protein [Pilimelia sp.]|nr:AMP-binding protein [Pilimelia sp.]